MATYKLWDMNLTQEQVDTAYTKGSVDQRAILNQKLGLSYDVNTWTPLGGTNIQGNVDTTLPAWAKSMSSSVTPLNVNIGWTAPVTENPVMIKTDTMKQYTPWYVPTTPEGVTGILGTPEKNTTAPTPIAPVPATPIPTPTGTAIDTSANVQGATWVSLAQQEKDLAQKRLNEATIAEAGGLTAEEQAVKTAELKKAADQTALDNARVSELNVQNAEYEATKRAQTDEAVAILEAQKKAAQEKADLAITEEESANKLAVAEAEKKQEASVIESRLGMAKLGLLGSSAALTQSQSIVSSVAYQMADLKVRAAGMVAKNKILATEVQLDFQWKINEVIANSTDSIQKNRNSTRNDIYSIQSSIVKSEYDKEKAIAELVDKSKKSQKEETDKMMKNLVQTQKDLQTAIENMNDMRLKEKERGKNEISTRMANGSWKNLSSEEQQNFAKMAGVSLKDTAWMENGLIYSTVDNVIDTIMKDVNIWYVLPPDKMANIMNLIKSSMDMGNWDIARATEVAINQVMRDDAEFQEAKRIQKEGSKKFVAAEGVKLNKDKFEESKSQFQESLKLKYDTLKQQASLARSRASASGTKTPAISAEFRKKWADSGLDYTADDLKNAWIIEQEFKWDSDKRIDSMKNDLEEIDRVDSIEKMNASTIDNFIGSEDEVSEWQLYKADDGTIRRKQTWWFSWFDDEVPVEEAIAERQKNLL